MKRTISVAMLALFFYACQSATSDNATSEATTTPDTEKPSTAASESSGTCLFSYQTRLDELLTKEDIAQNFTGDLSQAKFNYRTTAPKDYQQAIYTWPSDRTQQLSVGGRTMEVPSDNRLGVGNISQYKPEDDAVKKFKFMYRTLTEEEKEQARQVINQKLEEHTKKDGEKLSDTEKKTGNTLGGGLVGMAKYESVEGVGDAASWHAPESALIVLKGRTAFRVFAEVSANEEDNKALAKKLAETVLAKCK